MSGDRNEPRAEGCRTLGLKSKWVPTVGLGMSSDEESGGRACWDGCEPGGRIPSHCCPVSSITDVKSNRRGEENKLRKKGKEERASHEHLRGTVCWSGQAGQSVKKN